MAAADDGFEALLEPFYNGKRLTDPISTAEDKWQLLPAFLKVKGEYHIHALRLTLTTVRPATNSTPATPQMGRRKLELLPRSGGSSVTGTPLASPKGDRDPTVRSNPFGAAKYVIYPLMVAAISHP